MNLKLIAVLNVLFVTWTEATKSGKEIKILPDQMDTCGVFPQIKCTNDCSSLRVCYDAETPPITLKCPANRPYCANGKCGTENGNCQTRLKDDPQNFVCSSDGIFPDPTDCTNWYICNGAIVTKVSCGAGFIFNSRNNTCVRGTPRIDHASKKICQKISCDKKPNDYVLFPANPVFYADCSNGLMVLYKCDDTEIFDISVKKCVFDCKSAGYFPDPSDCTVYYFCKGKHKFKVKTLHCAAGHVFDGIRCVPGVDCGSTTTTTERPTPSTPPTTDTTTPSTTSSTDRPTPSTPPTTDTTTPSTTPSTDRPTPSTPPATVTTTPSTTLSTDRPTPSLGPTMPSTSTPFSNHQDPIDQRKTTKSPSYSLWKHNGKYSVRLP